MRRERKIQAILMALMCLVLLILTLLLLSLSGRAAVAEPAAGAAGMIDLTGLCNAVIAVLCALVTHKLLPWIKANTAQKQQAMLQAAIDTAVYAAQQLYKTKVITDRLDYATCWLERHGYTVDRAQIEAAVRRMDALALEISAVSEEVENTDEPDH